MKTSNVITGTFCIAIAAAVTLPGLAWLAGYHPNVDGMTLATYIAETSGDPRECDGIIATPPFSFGTDVGYHRTWCKENVAVLTADPSACAVFEHPGARFTCLQLVRNKLEYGATYELRHELDCSKLQKENDVARCRFKNAADAKDSALCSKITVESWWNLCLLWTGLREES